MRKEKLDYPFFIVPYAAFYDKRLDSFDTRVRLAIISRCMRSNHTEVGEATLARDLNLGLRTVQRSLAKLTRLGLIVRRRRIGTSSVTEIVDVRNLYENINTTYFDVTSKAAQGSKEATKKKAAKEKKKVPPSRLIGGSVAPNRRHSHAQQADTSRLPRRGNYIKGDQIKSEVDKDPPAGAKTQTYEKARDGSRYEYRKIKRLPGVPQDNLDAFVAIAAKQCAEHGLDQESHIISAVEKGIESLCEWNQKERLRDTAACFRKVIGNIVYALSQKIVKPDEREPDLSALYEEEPWTTPDS